MKGITNGHSYLAEITSHDDDGWYSTCNYYPLEGIGDDWDDIKEDIFDYFDPEYVSKVRLYRSDDEVRVYNMETKEYE